MHSVALLETQGYPSLAETAHFYYRDSAAHEVGHGLTAKELGATRICAVMPGPPHGRGYCSYTAPRARDELDELFDSLVISLAGTAAEHLAAGLDPLGPGLEFEIAKRSLLIETRPAPNAWEAALDVLERLCEGDRSLAESALSRELEGLLLRAVAILKKRSAELERLTARLEREREILI